MFTLRIHDKQLAAVLHEGDYQDDDLDLVIAAFKISVAEHFNRWTIHFEGDEHGGQMFALSIQTFDAAYGYADGDPSLLATIEKEVE
jgi:hypothetical protein